MASDSQSTVSEARAALAAIRARVEAMPPSTVPPEALHKPTAKTPLDLARDAADLAERARDTGCTTVAIAAAMLAAQYLQLAKIQEAARAR